MTLWRTFYLARLLFALFAVFIVATAVLNISLAPQANTEVDAPVARVGDVGDIPEIEVALHQDGTDTVGGGLSRSIGNGLRTLDDLRLAVLDYASVNKVLVVAAAGNNADLGNQPNCPAAHLGGVEGGWATGLSVGATGPTEQRSSFWTRLVLFDAIDTALLLCLGCMLQPVKARIPEAVQVRLQIGQALWTDAIEPSGALPPFGDQASVAQYVKVLRDRGAGHVKLCGDLTGGKLDVSDQRKDLAATNFC